MEDTSSHLHDEPAIEGQHDGQMLRQMLEQHQISIQEFADHFLKKSKAVAYAFLRKARFTREELAMACYFMNCTAQDFLYPPDYLLTRANKDLLENNKNNVAAFHALAQYEQDAINGKKFIEEYFDDLTKYSCFATHSLRIFHYLSKNKHQYRPTVLGPIHAYYAALEKRMQEQPQLQYTRFFALPIGLSELPEEIQDQPFNIANEALPLGSSEDKILSKSIDIMLPETIRHLVFCLSNFPKRFNLYAIHIPPRLNSFTVVDDKYVISEYDRINRHRKVSHDIMFVDRIVSTTAEDPIAMLLKVYNRDLDNLMFNAEYTQRVTIQLEEIYKVIFDQFAAHSELLDIKRKLLGKKQANLQTLIFKDLDTNALKEVLEVKSEILHLEERLKDWEDKLNAIRQVIG